jgi:hypothetical protein
MTKYTEVTESCFTLVYNDKTTEKAFLAVLTKEQQEIFNGLVQVLGNIRVINDIEVNYAKNGK